MVISLVSLKGGSGKTTIAINLAVYLSSLGNSVLIIDADENQNSVKWSGIREEKNNKLNPVAVMGLKEPAALRNNINEFKDRFDFIVIDGTPAINLIATTIMMISDVCLFPLQGSPLDVWAFNDIFIPRFEEVKAARPDLEGLILLNNIDKRTRLSKDVQEFAKECDVPLLNNYLTGLQVYKDSIAYGLGVIETKSRDAMQQILKLGDELEKYLKAQYHESA